MLLVSSLLLFAVVVFSGCKVDTKTVPVPDEGDAGARIIGGTETEPYAYPFIVSIQDNEEELPYCGGSLLNDRYILTAAHCVYLPKDNINYTPDDIYVVLGEHNMFKEDGQVKRTIDKIIRHETYPNGHSRFDSDIALLRLEQPITFNERISSICLSTNQNLTGEHPTAIGWGQTEKWYLPEVLTEITVPVLDDMWCNDAFHANYYAPHMVCAGYPWLKGYKDICRGDSGGPLFLNPPGGKPAQIGIVSFNSAFGCAMLHYPSSYTRVSVFREWIESNVEGSVCFVN